MVPAELPYTHIDVFLHVVYNTVREKKRVCKKKWTEQTDSFVTVYLPMRRKDTCMYIVI